MNKKAKFRYIGEVCKITGIPSHVIRFWEKEITSLKPLRDHNGHRIYAEQDIAKINRIKYLVYENGYSIKGVKKNLREQRKELPSSERKFLQGLLREVKEAKKCLR